MNDKNKAGIVVPPERLSPEALLGVIDEFITREGTDYGHEETDIEAKRAQVRRQLDDGEAVILFDPATESVNVLLERDRKKGEQDDEFDERLEAHEEA